MTDKRTHFRVGIQSGIQTNYQIYKKKTDKEDAAKKEKKKKRRTKTRDIQIDKIKEDRLMDELTGECDFISVY